MVIDDMSWFLAQQQQQSQPQLKPPQQYCLIRFSSEPRVGDMYMDDDISLMVHIGVANYII